MPGLIDTDTGLQFGEGLQWQTEIGTATLIIGPVASHELELFWGGEQLFWGGYELAWGL